MSKDQTKKRKYTEPVINKKELWKLFDAQKPEEKLECISSSTGCNREFCDQCETSLCFSEEGFLLCTNPSCGIIYTDIVDQSAEWRYYGAEDNQGTDPTRCGMPMNPLLKESSLACKIICGPKASYDLRKMRRYSDWHTMSYKEKTQYDDFQKITTISQIAGIPKLIIDVALGYHKKISEYEISFRGDNRDGILAASIYISFRIHNYPRTPKEIASIFSLDITSATRGCKNAMDIINSLERDMIETEKTVYCKITPDAFIERYCSKLSLNQELTMLCKFIAVKIGKQNLIPENTPQSIAAGVVFFVAHLCKLSIKKCDVRDISDISEVTINKCFKKLNLLKHDLLPPTIIQKYGIC